MLTTLPYLIGLRDDSQDALILQALERGFQDKLKAVGFISLAAQWKPALVAGSLWTLLANKSKPIRDAAARRWEGWATTPSHARASCFRKRKPIPGPRPSPCWPPRIRPKPLNFSKNKPTSRPTKTSAMPFCSAWRPHGPPADERSPGTEIEARIARVADKLDKPPAEWIVEERLPAVRFKDGEPLGKEAVRFLLYRQSRAKEIRPDVEAKPLYAMIDRKSSGDFAVEILKELFGLQGRRQRSLGARGRRTAG